MGKNENITINTIPSPTWHWLNMNEAHAQWDMDAVPCDMTVDGEAVCGSTKCAQTDNSEETGAAVGSATAADIEMGAVGGRKMSAAIPTGAGCGADALFDGEHAARAEVIAATGDTGRTVRVSARSNAGSSAAGLVCVSAEKNSDMTVIETFPEGVGGSLAFRTQLHIDDGAHVRLVQIFMQGESKSLLSDVGCVCGENAGFSLLQIFLGKGNLYDGVRAELVGCGSHTDMEIGYLGQRQQTIDVNLIVNHIGKKTNSEIEASGTLKDAAQKIFRGTIDFKNGSSESKGAETESVLLLGDDVVNKTIPVILCAEEDVEGAHGATIGELDEETLFYFASRGIDAREAEDIMAKGKMEVLYRSIRDEETEKLAGERLAEVMAYDREEL